MYCSQNSLMYELYYCRCYSMHTKIIKFVNKIFIWMVTLSASIWVLKLSTTTSILLVTIVVHIYNPGVIREKISASEAISVLIVLMYKTNEEYMVQAHL